MTNQPRHTAVEVLHTIQDLAKLRKLRVRVYLSTAYPGVKKEVDPAMRNQPLTHRLSPCIAKYRNIHM